MAWSGKVASVAKAAWLAKRMVETWTFKNTKIVLETSKMVSSSDLQCMY